jgi:endonuclease/exonuclease/phosphatase family metal-dependent hydrolase
MVNGEEIMRSKPEEEVQQLIANILSEQPDILGVCEIGTRADLIDLQTRLANRGLDLPHFHIVGGADPYRRLAILSKLPLTASPKPTINYTYDGKRHIVLRGILDVAIKLPSGEVRFVGAHLKSKRKNKYFDQALIRRNEAELVRKHTDEVLTENPNIIVYGDFNDTRQSPSVRAIAGDHGSHNYLHALNLTDSAGHRWTHYWKHQDIYSRFDYAFVSSSLKSRIDLERSHIHDTQKGDISSDHRPLIITFR